jgi:hypothetical protein
MDLAIAEIEKEILKKSLKKVIIFLTWMPQLSLDEFQKIEKLEKVTDIIYVGVSILTADQIRGEKREEFRYMFEKEFSRKKSRIHWVSDYDSSEYLNTSFVKEIPDYAEMLVLSKKDPEYNLGFFGLQTPYRGLFEIFTIALFNPRLKVCIKGAGFAPHRIFRPWKKPSLGIRVGEQIRFGRFCLALFRHLLVCLGTYQTSISPQNLLPQT